MEITTIFGFGRQTNLTIPTFLIHDIVINEVFIDVSAYILIYFCIYWIKIKNELFIKNLQIKVVYIMQVLTKGRLFRSKPVIPVLNVRCKFKQFNLKLFIYFLNRVCNQTWIV